MSKSVKFAPGQSTASIRVPIIDNDIGQELNVTFTVTIIPHGDIKVIVLSNCTVTIVDDDQSKQPYKPYTYYRDATIHIFSVSIYHLFCITIQRYIARYGIV